MTEFKTMLNISFFQAVIRACRKLATRIRCIGSAHSWAPSLADGDSLLMYMKGLKREHGDQIILLEVNGIFIFEFQ